MTAPQQTGPGGYGPPPQGAPLQGVPPQGAPGRGMAPQAGAGQGVAPQVNPMQDALASPSASPQQSWPQPPPAYPAPHQFAPTSTPTSAPTGEGARPQRLAGWVTVSGAAVVIVGSVLPWASVMLVGPIYGTEGDGILTIICAVIVALAALPALLGKGRRWMFGVAAFFGLVAAAIGGYDLSNMSALVGEESMASLGPGLPVIVLGGLVVLTGSILGIAKGKRG